MKTTRVLHIIDSISVNSGVCSVILNYYFAMNHDLVQFDFLTYDLVDDELREKLEATGSKFFSVAYPKIKIFFSWIKEISNFFCLHNEYSIVHCNLPNAAIFFLGIAKKNNVPVRIIHSHSTGAAENKFKYIRNKVLFAAIPLVANYYFACSDKAADFLFGKNLESVTILNNAINCSEYNFDDENRKKYRKKLDISDETLLIGHVGRFAPVKNHSYLIEIFTQLQKLESNSRMIMIGDGPLFQAIKNQIATLGMQDKVIFTGSVKNVQDYMQAMDIFVMPSKFEGLSIVTVEAQCSGLPCVLSDQIPRQVVFSNADPIFISIKESPAVWARKIFDIFKIRGDRTSFYDKRFDMEVQKEKLQNFYLDLALKIENQ